MSVSYSLASDWLCSDGFYVGVPLLSMSNLSFDTSLNAIPCNQVWGFLLAAFFGKQLLYLNFVLSIDKGFSVLLEGLYLKLSSALR